MAEKKSAGGGSVRGKSRNERKKRSASYNQTPEMPKEKGNDGFSRGKSFLPGVGGGWSAPVGKRRTRRLESGAEEKNRTMSDNYGQGTPRAPKEYRDGGMVRGYEGGGEVCRGGGKAMSGTKFRGVR